MGIYGYLSISNRVGTRDSTKIHDRHAHSYFSLLPFFCYHGNITPWSRARLHRLDRTSSVIPVHIPESKSLPTSTTSQTPATG
eukprot:scaffold37692_cov60-Cyclotella_meneghiniana.AAC.4